MIELILNKIFQLTFFKLLNRLPLLIYYFHTYLLKLKLIISVNEVGKIRIPVMSDILVCSLLGIEKLCGIAQKKKRKVKCVSF